MLAAEMKQAFCYTITGAQLARTFLRQSVRFITCQRVCADAFERI